MSMFTGTGKRRAETPQRGRIVADHAYAGNLCSGFGGTTECEYMLDEAGSRCGRQPHEHRPPKHRADPKEPE